MEVLLVEDNPEVSLITVEYLTELGHSVFPVLSAELALERLSERPYDAVLTDVSLPGISGIDLAKKLVEQFPKLPVVISSGYGAQSVEFGLGRREPGVFLLPKPYDLDTLEKILAEASEFSASSD